MNGIKEIRKILNLNDEPWNDLDDDLLEIAFIPQKSNVDVLSIINILEKYNQYNYETFEFLGDAILEMIIARILYENFVMKNVPINSYKLTLYKTEFVKNLTLYCHMRRKNLCGYIKNTSDKRILKQCADVLEAIIGILYHYLFYIKQNKDALNILHDWFIDNFYVRETIKYISSTGLSQYHTKCNDVEQLVQNCPCQIKQLSPQKYGGEYYGKKNKLKYKK